MNTFTDLGSHPSEYGGTYITLSVFRYQFLYNLVKQRVHPVSQLHLFNFN